MSRNVLRWHTRGLSLPIPVIPDDYKGGTIWSCTRVGDGSEVHLDSDYMYGSETEALYAYIHFVEQIEPLLDTDAEALRLQIGIGLALANSRLENER